MVLKIMRGGACGGGSSERWWGGGGEWIFFSKAWSLGAALGPQWVQGNTLVGTQGANPPEASEF